MAEKVDQMDPDEKIVEIAIERLRVFENHPFRVEMDSQMKDLQDSIKKYGIITPVIVRPRKEGYYEIISGHRRIFAAEKLGYRKVPTIIRYMTDDQAVIAMVDSNLQRERIQPSEKAFAYKMKLEAMKHQGERVDLTCSQVGNKFAGKKSSEILAEQVGQSKNQIFRFIRLTELIPPLLDMVDEKKIALSPAYELSFLKPEEQAQLVETMDYEQATPSLSQAQRLKKFSQEGKLTEEVMLAIMSEEKPNQKEKIVLRGDRVRQLIPKNIPISQTEDFVCKALEHYNKYLRQRADRDSR